MPAMISKWRFQLLACKYLVTLCSLALVKAVLVGLSECLGPQTTNLLHLVSSVGSMLSDWPTRNFLGVVVCVVIWRFEDNIASLETRYYRSSFFVCVVLLICLFLCTIYFEMTFFTFFFSLSLSVFSAVTYQPFRLWHEMCFAQILEMCSQLL